MSTDLIPVRAAPLALAAQAADHAAARHVFASYRARRAAETIRRQNADLALFATFLATAGMTAPIGLATSATAWQGVTWGLVEAFVAWQLQEGYAVGSVNVRLSTVKAYATLATRAGTLPAEALALIKLVRGYQHAEGKRADAQRTAVRRDGAKKAAAVELTPAQAAQLKEQTNPRDRLLLCVLLDHGLRVGEAALLTSASFDLRRGLLRFYRPKVDKTQIHRLTADTRAAAVASLPALLPDTHVFPGERRIRTIVQRAGAALGIDHLSPHDGRHAWATFAIAGGTDIKALQDAGGWNSPAMPLRYAASADIANDGVRLG